MSHLPHELYIGQRSLPLNESSFTHGSVRQVIVALLQNLDFVLSNEQSEGVGAMVRRSIGRPELRNHDPFLMLDEFDSDPTGGFPDHPHRAFETVTYILEGQVQHGDFAGHKGSIGPGDLQWMTAGGGIVHSEMPVKSQTRAHGLQLWINLPKEREE
ncbi:hypothetical protein BGZ97_003095 [Linnemannia gamsii]|uniref:Pirin N-terminal domain-containing protein n=1 Tax=Linnemannia gamsii TaxID=64522 RepID=A0A9P6QTN9_9FUNG|nr:hypothetical protein BGZ97_003095 [Linnemannia gamsii]